MRISNISLKRGFECKVAALLIAFILPVFLTGCSGGRPADEAEVMEAAEKLIFDAVEVNRIFFWGGLPHEDPADADQSDRDLTDGNSADADQSDADSDETGEINEYEYLYLTEEYLYLDEADLMEKAEAVYTENYCAEIRRIAFEGIKAGEDRALYARYLVENGMMKINRMLAENGLPERLPEDGTLRFEGSSDRRTAEVSAEFVTQSGEKDRQTITLKLESDGWRIDTPTY